MWLLIAAVLITINAWKPAAVSQEEAPAANIRVAVACQANEPAAAGVQDTVAAALSHVPLVEVLDRGQVDLLLREGSLDALSQDATRRTRLGRLLALDYFLNLRRTAKDDVSPWLVEAVNAQTGALAGSVTVAAAPGTELEGAVTRFVQGTLLGKNVAKPDSVGSRRLAVLDFGLAEDMRGVSGAAASLRLSAELRRSLGGYGGVLVLDRSLSQQVAVEHNYRQAGLMDAPDSSLPMLGADFLVTGEVRHAPGEKGFELALTVLDTHGGRPLGAHGFSLAGGDAPLPSVAGEWVGQTLRIGRAGTKRTYQAAIQVEALEPLYHGIALFQAGRYLEATADFQRAYILNDKFGDAMLWEARCYDAVGLTPLAEAERRFVACELTGRGYASTGVARPEETVTFLGLAGNTDGPNRAAASKIEMLAVDLLAGLGGGGPPLQLASHLARFRDEYDALVGTSDASGVRWGEAPGFLSGVSLYGEITPPDAHGGRRIAWQIVDTLGGGVRARAETALDADPAKWGEALRGALTTLWKPYDPATGTEASPPPQLPPDLPAAAELAAQVSSRSGIDANVPLLGLLLRDPRNPLLLTHSLSKGGQNPSLETYLNFAIRDYLLAKLPVDAPLRPWLELERIDHFLPCDGTGPTLSGDYALDPHAELARFAAAHPDDAVGCVAAYQALYDGLGDLDPADLADRLEKLGTRTARYGEDDFFRHDLLVGMTGALRTTALIATGEHPELTLPTDVYPQVLYVRFSDSRGNARHDGKPGIEQEYGGWRTMEWGDTPESVRDPVQEARASLAVLGRGDGRYRVPARWLRDYPTSGVITGFAVGSLHEANWFLGQPILYEFDAAAERAHYREIVAYCYRNLCEHIDGARTAHEIVYWERWVHDLVRNLCEWGYLDTVTDAEFETMRADLVARTQAARDRCGTQQRYRTWSMETDWQRLVRRPTMPVGEFESLWGAPGTFYDRDALRSQARETGDRAWRNSSPLTDRTWSNLVHGQSLKDALTRTDLAELYLPYQPLLARYFPGPDLSYKEMAFLFDFGYTLMCGGKLAEAEEVFASVLRVPESDLNRFAAGRELRANAALASCVICRAADRKAEALAFAQQALAFCGERRVRVLGRYENDHFELPGNDIIDYSDCQTLCLRLSAELRGDPAVTSLPPQVKATVVRTPNLTNAETTFYYRVPADYDPHGGKPCPVLVLVPSRNEDALDYCLDSNAWARWADEQGIFLVVPEFLQIYDWGTGPEVSAEFQCAQVWSGAATLQAVENIRAAGYHVAAERLLLHAFGAGAQFAARFARWAPERCAALSMHNSSRWSWFDWTPGLKPLDSLRGVPCLATTGERDKGRRAAAVQWVTMARGAGLPVTWKELPGVGHYPTPEMESLSRDFLAAHAHDPPPPVPIAVNTAP